MFSAKMSSSELTDNASAAMPTSRMKALRKDVPFLFFFFLTLEDCFPPLSSFVYVPASLASLEFYAPSRARFYARRREILH